MEATQQIKDKNNDYPTYLIVEQRRKALEVYNAIREKLAETTNQQYYESRIEALK
jgi:hypothetical protein